MEGTYEKFISDSMELFMQETEMDPEFTTEIFQDFLKSMPEFLQEMEAALRAEDYKALCLTAHRLKGASGNLRIEPVAQLAKELEAFAKELKKEESVHIMNKIKQLFKIV